MRHPSLAPASALNGGRGGRLRQTPRLERPTRLRWLRWLRWSLGAAQDGEHGAADDDIVEHAGQETHRSAAYLELEAFAIAG